MTCPDCSGRGYVEEKLRNLATLDYEWHTVPCHCDNGKIDLTDYKSDCGFIGGEQ